MHIKYNSIIYSCQVPEISKHSLKYELILHINILLLFSKKSDSYAFCGTNISWTITYFVIYPSLRTASLCELVCGTLFIWVSISSYIDNGIAKVTISVVIRVCVQGSISEICNWSLMVTLWVIYVKNLLHIFHFTQFWWNNFYISCIFCLEFTYLCDSMEPLGIFSSFLCMFT